MKDQHDNKTQDWLEVTMPLEVAQAALAAMNKVFMDWDVLNEKPPEFLKKMREFKSYVEGGK
jgi:hypothetical protein